jgi:hypothetical protein
VLGSLRGGSLDAAHDREGRRMAQIDSTQIAGTVVSPDDDDWDEARSAWHLRADQRPPAVVNFAERTTELDKLYDADTLARLQEVKERDDAGDVFSGGHALALA